MEKDKKPFDHLQDTQGTHKNLDNEIEVPVTEEELVADTREVQRGAVRVHKNVVEEEQSVEIPVTEEEVTVTRRDVDREVDPGSVEFGGDIRVPVMGEEVDVEKRARVVEEIEIRKTPVTHTEEHTGTVRREEIGIDEADGDAMESGNVEDEGEGI